MIEATNIRPRTHEVSLSTIFCLPWQINVPTWQLSVLTWQKMSLLDKYVAFYVRLTSKKIPSLLLGCPARFFGRTAGPGKPVRTFGNSHPTSQIGGQFIWQVIYPWAICLAQFLHRTIFYSWGRCLTLHRSTDCEVLKLWKSQLGRSSILLQSKFSSKVQNK